MKNVQTKIQNFRKNKRYSEVLVEFLSSQYVLESKTKRPLDDDMCPLVKRSKDDNTLETVNKKVCEEMQEIKIENEMMKGKMHKYEQQLARKQKFSEKRVNQMIQRKTSTIKRKDVEISQLKRKCKDLEMKSKLTLKPVVKASCRNCKINRKEVEDQKNVIDFLKERVQNYRSTIDELENKLTQFSDKINEMKSKLIDTKTDGKTFNSDLRMTVYELSTAEVSVENMSTVIKSVLHRLAKKDVHSLPDTKTYTRIVREMGALSRMHVQEVLSNEENTTLKYDGTSKKKTHYLEVQVESQKQCFTTGISMMASGTADSYSRSIVQSLDSVNNVNDGDVNLLSNISNTMTDRVVVNKKINSILLEKKQLTSGQNGVVWNNFFCSVHPLDTFAKAAEKTLKSVQPCDQGSLNVFRHRGESGTSALIQAVAKLFYNDGVGCPSDLNAFLHSKGIDQTPVYPFIGNRFNILFLNGAGVYFIREPLLYFLEKIWGTPNQLFQAVLLDLKNCDYVVGCRALGIVAKYVTGPWQRLTENTKRILDLNPFFSQAIDRLSEWAADPSPLVHGSQLSLFDGVSVKEDDIFRSLVARSDYDEQTKTVVGEILASVLEVCKRQLADQLPGGEHFIPSAELVEQAKSCSSHNISGERVFGKLDFNLKKAPNAKIDYLESKIIYAENRTSQWIMQKSEKEKDALIAVARASTQKNIPQVRQLYKDLLREKSEILKQKQKMIEQKAEKQRSSKENLVSELVKVGGLWMDIEQMERNLNILSSVKLKLMAVKTQIKVRKVLLSQNAEKSLFAFSANKKVLSLAQLKRNLIQLMQVGHSDQDSDKLVEILKEPKLLEYKYMSHLWTEETGDVWYKGFIHHLIEGESDILEFKVEYLDSGEVVYMEFDELVADIKIGDLIILWDENIVG